MGPDDVKDLPRLITSLRAQQLPAPSEADVIEKLIVPVLRHAFDSDSLRLEFFRASRDGRSSCRNWDLSFRYENGMEYLGVVECKCLNHEFKVSKRNIAVGTMWPCAGGLISGCGNAREYLKRSLDAQGDVLYQVWFYWHKEVRASIANFSGVGAQIHRWLFRRPQEGGCVLWSNGVYWCIFKKSFFEDSDNPPRIPVDEDGFVLKNNHMTMYNLGDGKVDFRRELERLRVGLRRTVGLDDGRCLDATKPQPILLKEEVKDVAQHQKAGLLLSAAAQS